MDTLHAHFHLCLRHPQGVLSQAHVRPSIFQLYRWDLWGRESGGEGKEWDYHCLQETRARNQPHPWERRGGCILGDWKHTEVGPVLLILAAGDLP